MEDFDYIDALVKSELSGREATPSNNGWDIVKEKLQRKKKKRRFFLLLLFFVGMSSVGIYKAINFNSEINANSITNKNTEQPKSGNTQSAISDSGSSSDSNATSVSNSDTGTVSTNISQAEKDALMTNDGVRHSNQSANKLQGNGSGIVESTSKVNSRGSDTKNNTIYNGSKKLNSDSLNSTNEISLASENEEILSVAKGLQTYTWELIVPETLQKKRKKKKRKRKKKPNFYENTDIMIGLNGFATANDYRITQSYIVELSYEITRELKNDYSFNYGGALQLRTLRLKKDNLNFTKGEVSFNLFSNIEKQFGDYSVEAGVYLGYEIYSPNNEFFNDKVRSFFDQKINYGLSTGINYKNIGLIFKYELSPYVNYLGDKKYGGFIIGVKYDF
ncbi:hypothetical protein [uncultured Kordia sp.]|uniref:hypothetical protein n=1 Tax=uncultured Kordia sp. TaxID=507699 RepID=UPI002616847E|nr:hypothetical protein [uncultured Kordia sp.]